jgi:hypothetical protein
MVTNGRLARAISDAGWGRFVRLLEEKARTLRPNRGDGVSMAAVVEDLLGLSRNGRHSR